MVYILGTRHFYWPIFSPLHMNCWFITFVIAEYYLQIDLFIPQIFDERLPRVVRTWQLTGPGPSRAGGSTGRTEGASVPHTVKRERSGPQQL